MSTQPSRCRRLLAWCVHGYTALGLVAAAGMARFIVEGTETAFCRAFVLMLAATLIDATDGLLARAVGVKQALPGFDGRRLDDIVDFLTYTGLPLLLLWRAGILPPGREELEKLACWIDLVVPYCGDYVEANAWSPFERARYDYFLAKRKTMEAVESRNIRQMSYGFPGIAPSGGGQEDIRRGYDAGLAAHLTEPASREAVIEAIEPVMARK